MNLGCIEGVDESHRDIQAQSALIGAHYDMYVKVNKP